MPRMSIMQIKRIAKRFEHSGSVADGRHTNKGRPKCARSKENIESVRTVIEETPQKSVRQVLKDKDSDNTCISSVYRILRFDLHLTPYHISIMQHLKDSDIHSWLAFACWIIKQPQTFPETVWFSDEAHFHLHNEVNKQNFRFWGLKIHDSIQRNPYITRK
ncbi:uncharacterized protein LOC117318041 [Pecten maximus]|uniref:uncharacterized protein LOC117318041 n=1 Tax=Pecten maximus TaxID=6579 RepID=UPI0014590DF4|nr:uncharacterized protein LOC117318041 [Pecten maximus]